MEKLISQTLEQHGVLGLSILLNLMMGYALYRVATFESSQDIALFPIVNRILDMIESDKALGESLKANFNVSSNMSIELLGFISEANKFRELVYEELRALSSSVELLYKKTVDFPQAQEIISELGDLVKRLEKLLS